MHTLIFTHYDEGSNINFITFVKSIASNLPAGDLFELIVIAEKIFLEKYNWHILDEPYLMNQSIELDDRLNSSKLVKLLSKIIKF